VTTSFGGFLLRRALAALAFVLVVSTSTLMLARLAPGDATTEMALSGVDAKTIAVERTRLGLDRSLFQQLGDWFGGLARFDLGTSSQYNRPVTALVAEHAPKTALLATVALVLATCIGLPLGVLSGARPRGWLAMIVTPISTLLVACPPLVGALALMLLAVSIGWSISPGQLAVPALALALPVAAMLERLQSQATSEVLGAPDLIATAARGVPPLRLLWVHAARQSLRPVLGVYGIVIGSLFSGSLAVEIVTAWPGLGRLMFDGLRSRDLFLVTGCALFGAFCLAAGNFLADVARAFIDPRVREHA
jgi:ABC-type dipeptide/oligopeptide/nickel transport system permease component